jgi:putative heme iron utilization protein
MRDAIVYWLATSEEEIHFIDAIISAYDGMAAVRRDFRILNGQAMYKIYVSPGMEDEFLEVAARLRETAAITDLIRDDDPAIASG